MPRALGARTLRRVMNLWPPFLFSGVHVQRIADDWRSAEVHLRSRPWNRNYVGVHFGGNLFSMTDPFWMLLTLKALGPGYIVWDKAGEIEFLKPGKGLVVARFSLDDATLDEISAATAGGDKHLRWMQTEVIDAQGEIVARVRKQLYIRRKRERGSA